MTAAAKARSPIIYFTDNGRVLCIAHLGMSAKMTGRDISGQRIQALHAADHKAAAELGFTLTCESCDHLSTQEQNERIGPIPLGRGDREADAGRP